MDQNNLRPIDLIDVFGSRAAASQVLNGKREISKAHARRLADRFRLPTDLFI
jgi:HTH-type transcriptional regulator/antitoxin HigA